MIAPPLKYDPVGVDEKTPMNDHALYKGDCVWAVSTLDDVNTIGHTGLARPGRMPVFTSTAIRDNGKKSNPNQS